MAAENGDVVEPGFFVVLDEGFQVRRVEVLTSAPSHGPGQPGEGVSVSPRRQLGSVQQGSPHDEDRHEEDRTERNRSSHG